MRTMHAVDAIRAFWVWWETARARVLDAIEGDRVFTDELIEDISSHVAAIADLDWELGAGTTSRHAFFLSAKGDPEGRLITELWRSMGPPPDEVWSYYPARQPRRGSPIELEGVRIDPAELRISFEVESARERVHAAFWHPAFETLDADARPMALFLLLDGEFGEDGVERWLGSIDVSDEPGESTIEEFRAAVDELAQNANGKQFAVLRGENDDGEPVFVTANLALKRIDHLLNTMHLAVDFEILDRNDHGLPTPADAEQLNALEDELSAQFVDAVYYGRETRPGRRTIHWYVPEDSAAQRIVEDFAKLHPDRKLQLMLARDPTWELIKRY
jgi:Family of unknown function (DUF695)